MAQLRELLVEQLQDLLNAENQLTKALPQMAEAAHNPKLKEGFQKHLQQTENHIGRLKEAFGLLGEKAQPKACKAMAGLVEEGKETIAEGKGKDALSADLALIAIAQKVEHYEIAGYGNLRGIARLINERGVAELLDFTLGEEEATDFLLTEISKPILQEARLNELEGTRTTAQVAG